MNIAKTDLGYSIEVHSDTDQQEIDAMIEANTRQAADNETEAQPGRSVQRVDSRCF